MKKSVLSFILGSIVHVVPFAQSNELIWAQSTGAGEFDMTRDVCTDDDGNVITVGQFNGTVDFDPGVGTMSKTSAGASDIFVKKQDADGNLLWVHHFGAYDSDAAYSVDSDASGNIYLTGVFRYEVDWDPGTGTFIVGDWGSNLGHIFLLKLTPDGNLTWINNIHSPTGTCQGLLVAVEDAGDVIISGTFNGTTDFDVSAGTTNLTANSTTNYDMFVARYNTLGELSWAGSFGGTASNNFPYGMALDASNNILITGSFGGTADLDPGAGVTSIVSNGYDDVFILKISSSGTLQWAKAVGGIWGDVGNSISSDADENVYVVGDFRQDVDFDPGAGNTTLSIGSSQNSFLLKLTANGNFVRVRSFVNGNNTAQGMDVDADNNVYVTGYFSTTVDFDPGAGVSNLTAGGTNDMFVQQMDSAFNFGWVKQVIGTGDVMPRQIEITNDLEIYTVGYFNGTADFDPGVGIHSLVANSVGGGDHFTQKMGPCNLDLSVSTSGVTLTANQGGATYAWMNCATFATIGVTTQSLTPPADGDYAVIITQGGCKDTSSCYPVLGVGLNEFNAAEFLLYPNPSAHTVTVQTEHPVELIEIYTSSGVLVQTVAKNTFSIEDLPTGIYVLYIKTSYGVGTARLVKE